MGMLPLQLRQRLYLVPENASIAIAKFQSAVLFALCALCMNVIPCGALTHSEKTPMHTATDPSMNLIPMHLVRCSAQFAALR